MNISKKDIVALVVGAIIIATSIFFMMRLLSPQSTKVTTTSKADLIPTVPTTFDDKTFESVKSLSDYGVPSLKNIGKSDIFSRL